MALLLIFLGFFFTQPKLDKEKLSAYECGFEPFESARIKFNIHYYLVAILFVVFDAEIILMFP
jgi:NADH-quinone oxidoreductase subunit A